MPDGNIIARASHFFPPMKLGMKKFDAGRCKESGHVIRDEEAATRSDEL